MEVRQKIRKTHQINQLKWENNYEAIGILRGCNLGEKKGTYVYVLCHSNGRQKKLNRKG